MKPIDYPDNCKNEASKMAYCQRRIHLLTKLQEIMGQWYRDGITQTKYNKLPPEIKDLFPYTAKISPTQLKDFWNNFYKPWEKTFHYEFNKNQNIAGTSEYWGTPNFRTVIDTDGS